MSGVSTAQRFYGRWARLYDVLARATPGIGDLRSQAVAALALDRGDTVVEMGCGTGANLPYLREWVGPEGTVVGIDYTRGMLDRAQRLVDERGWDNVHLVHGDATNPPIDGPVDGILSMFVVGMLSDPATEVDAWFDMVEPDGTVVLVDAALSERPIARPLNALFRGLTVLSTPPTFKFRYEHSPHETLRERVRTAHETLRSRSRDSFHREYLLGIVRVSGGKC
jgi:ubiquinone/menaquinone biosynthesis C-methylase UbiE